MKIEDKRKNIGVKFENVKPGSCFIFNDKIYIRTADKEGWNSVGVESGETKYICFSALVFPVDAKVVIE